MINLIKIFTHASIRYQLTIGIGFLLTVLISSFIYVTSTSQGDFLHDQGVSQAKKRSMMLGGNAKVWVLSNDYMGLEEVVNNFKIHDDIIFAAIINMDGKVIAHTDRKVIGKYISDKERIAYLKSVSGPNPVHEREGSIFANNDKHIDAFQIIHEGDKHIGFVHIRQDQSVRQESINAIMRQGIVFTLISLVIGVFLAYLTANSLTNSLSNLISAMAQIRMGKNIRADERGAKEVHQLSHEFNLLLDAIREEEQKVKDANLEVHNKEEIMLAQSRHAAMGEMISMIAHQWRQPISVISMGANNILADIELEMIKETTLREISKDIIKQTQELSKTIDDFRNFFKPDRLPEEVFAVDVVNEALGVVGKSLENNNIEIYLEIDEKVKILTFSRELMQVLINIVKNAKEASLENSIQNSKITISIKEQNNHVHLSVCDNAGGVSSEVIKKIFNPYFTTKSKMNGTGLGLYMSRTIVEKHLQGSIDVKNVDDGACFEIIIPHAIVVEEIQNV